MKVSIVIPTYNHYHLLHQCLYDIYSKCSLVDEVIIVNDNSPDKDVYDGLKWWKGTGFLPIREVRLEENVMFLKASNIGMRKATGDVVILLSNDVRIYHDIVGLIVDLLDQNPKLLVGGRLLDFDTGWNTLDGQIFPYIEGWLLAGTSNAWQDWGYFDERFAPSDMEDVDLATKALMVGYGLHAIPSDFTQHLGAQSIGYNPAREAITIANKEKFRKKWVG